MHIIHNILQMKCTKQYLHILKTFTVEIVKKEKMNILYFFYYYFRQGSERAESFVHKRAGGQTRPECHQGIEPNCRLVLISATKVYSLIVD